MARTAHQLSTAVGEHETSSVIGRLLGRESFSAGVVFGMVKNLATSVYQLADLFKTFALAEYDDVRHSGSFLQRVGRAMAYGPTALPLMGGLFVASSAWQRLDQQASRAVGDRDALVQLVTYSFEHPSEVFGNIRAAEMTKFKAFSVYIGKNTMSGEFQAGVLMGELLLDVLLVVDGATAIAKLASKSPALLKMLPRLEKLAPALREAIRRPETPRSEFAEGKKPEPVQRRVQSGTDIHGRAPAMGAGPTLEKGGQGSATSKFLEGVEQGPYTPDKLLFGQSTNASCAAASCRMASGIDQPEAYIRDAIGTTDDGTALANIPGGLEKLGFDGTATYSENLTAQGVEEVTRNGSSAVVSVWQGGAESHAIVVDSISNGTAFIRDPWPPGAGSSYSIPSADLQKAMTGRGVLITPGL